MYLSRRPLRAVRETPYGARVGKAQGSGQHRVRGVVGRERSGAGETEKLPAGFSGIDGIDPDYLVKS